MRRSLLVRLVAVSLSVAALAVVATALLATYGTGTRLREELESGDSLLETDSDIRAALLGYAGNNDSWDGVEPLVRELAQETGRRIALTTPDGETIADSADLLGQGGTELPSTPAAAIDVVADARGPTTPADMSETAPTGTRSALTWQLSNDNGVSYHGWQMSDEELAQRDRLIDDAEACLDRGGLDATIQAADGPGGGVRGLFVAAAGEIPAGTGQLWASPEVQACVPDELYAPSEVAREINDTSVDLTLACLDDAGLDHQVSEDSYGMRIVEPVADGEKPQAWRNCAETAQSEAMQPYVAPPAQLYLGTSDRFDPFAPDAWWRTAMTVAVVLLVAAVATVLAGRRLVRPILALTGAAQRMAQGDRSVRVPVSGRDEVARLADGFNGMAESIARSERQRKALVSDVAHELRTPLANVRTHLEAVDVGLAPLDDSLVESLREESAVLERLVSDLQDLALADAGMLRIHPEERDAGDIAAQAVAGHRAQAEASGVELRLDVAGQVPVFADPVRLRQALGNLVSNAVMHTPAGGTVEVAVNGRADDVVLTVSDTGDGIDPQHLPHLFDRFYRADPSRSRATGGSGLGLAITKHLVEAHGGSVDVASEPGDGSAFTIRLPQVRMSDMNTS
ncbi:sensor histidine kinase [Phytoactinopolyspora halotolerans]|uniref:histidine kinase n=1 Tax=Phytoactinopolyspora halotolerans TaxID=1981512 RepID=A0A6L9S6K6_9ACTN|nr:HAMP domain-containing sensor histidine kinase [Phytoactinopolyspora halotolerans]NEE00391.1 HAMP domain-containing histidine kinase [Phytoactinopolyspora halotolerans]